MTNESDTSPVIRIGHFSDLHLPLGRAVHPRQLAGKRLLGYLNLRFNRSKTHKLDAFAVLLAELVKERPDFTIMTGDLTSLAFEFEFAAIDELFRSAGLQPETTLIIPGNHDRYALLADIRCAFERSLAAWLPEGFSRSSGYPLCRLAPPVAIFGLDTAVWRNPIRAAGHLSAEQIARLRELLESARAQALFPIIAMHHPPFHLRRTWLRDYRSGLDGGDDLLTALSNRVCTVLHGHLHAFSRRRIQNLDVIGVPAASNDASCESRQLAYHVYTFSREGLKTAEGVRYWPRRSTGQFERYALPLNAFVD